MMGLCALCVVRTQAALKNPLSAVLTVGALAALGLAIKLTVAAMLGLEDTGFQYVQGNF
jgi:hypothetical protein